MKQKFIDWIKGSADNNPGGASSKKLSAFWTLVILVTAIVITWLIWAYRHDNWGMYEYTLTALLMFAATALGINSVEKIKGKANIPDPEEKKTDEQPPGI